MWTKRTIQNDINILEADYGIMLDEKLKRGRQRLYRYRDTTLRSMIAKSVRTMSEKYPDDI